jgi:hypothetical protein
LFIYLLFCLLLVGQFIRYLVTLLATFPSMALWPNGDKGFLIHEVSRAQTDMPHWVGLLWTSDQLVAEVCNQKHTTTTREYYHDPVGLEPALSAGERPQTHALDQGPLGSAH